MVNELRIFEHPQYGTLRSFEINGEPWFIAKDTTDMTGHKNGRKALRDHVDAEDKNTVTVGYGIP